MPLPRPSVAAPRPPWRGGLDAAPSSLGRSTSTTVARGSRGRSATVGWSAWRRPRRPRSRPAAARCASRARTASSTRRPTRTPEVTKLMVAQYFASVEDGLMRALRDRPTALERWTSGVRPGHEAGDRPAGQGRRRVLPEAGAQGGARLPRERADHLPERAHRRGDLPDRDRRPGVVRAHGHADLPPVARAPRRRRPPRRAPHRPRPAARHHLRRRRPRGRAWPTSCCASSGSWATPRPAATAASTSTCGSAASGSSPTSATPRSGSVASSPERDDGVTVDWWKEERGERIFVDFNQNNRDRTIASAYSLRPIPGAPVSTPVTWAELAGLD